MTNNVSIWDVLNVFKVHFAFMTISLKNSAFPSIFDPLNSNKSFLVVFHNKGSKNDKSDDK